ncbi:uncharacterized protein LOC128211168 [Mya arenaria]|uniref:uncharacterized protein LOC128211168 n=1 Tax=Mya arenaria TaxID=6604 RepID=UPI0022E828E7|nr:uncharacterized protein LOC128211168 [Mya arenaria]
MGTNQSIASTTLEQKQQTPWMMITYCPTKYTNKLYYNPDFHVYTTNESELEELEHPCPPQPVDVTSKQKKWVKERVDNITTDMSIRLPNLVDHLMSACINTQQGTTLNKADKVTILFYWLVSKDIKKLELPPSIDTLSVAFQLRQLKLKRNTYAVVFALLCSFAKIPCVIVRGHVKGGKYEPCDQLSSKHLREWNAVLVDNGWSFVDPFWGVATEHGGQSQSVDWWYLFPRPQDLIFSHFPDVEEWQLLEKPVSKADFEKQAYLKRRFFELQIMSVSEENGQIKTETGSIEIDFGLNPGIDGQSFECVVHRYVVVEHKWKFIDPIRDRDIAYILCLVKDQNQPGNKANPNTSKLLTVEAIFSQRGKYKLEIVGKTETQKFDWIAIYHVNVVDVKDMLREKIDAVIEALTNALASEASLIDLQHAITFTKNTCLQNNPDVNPLYLKALRAHKLELYKDKIPQIDNNVVAQLRSLKNPSPKVVQIMRATLLLLGDNKENVRFWEDMIPKLTSIGTDNVKSRIKAFDIKSASKNLIADVKRELVIDGEEIDILDAINSYHEIAAFAKWLSVVFESHGGIENSNC